MIRVKIYRNADKNIFGFEIENHGDPIVCSAVSMLSTNVVNSIETFTDAHFTVDCDEKNLGYMKFILPDIETGRFNSDVNLLLKSFLLGLESITESYKNELKIKEIYIHTKKEVQ